MSTAFVTDTGSVMERLGAAETSLEGLPVSRDGVVWWIWDVRDRPWQEAQEGGSMLFDPDRFRESSISASLDRLHSALTPFTTGTVTVHFFDVSLADTKDAIFSARARERGSWLVETGVFTGATAPSRAWRTFEELSRWIGIGKVRTAALLSISRGTTNAWKAGREPQPANARRLYRTHTMVKTLVRRLGLEAARSWLESGEPSPLELLAAGDLAAVDRAASALVFDGGAQASERIGAFTPEADEEAGDIPTSGDTPRPRRVRRSAPRRRAQ